MHLRTFARQADGSVARTFGRSTLFIDNGPSVFGYSVQFNLFGPPISGPNVTFSLTLAIHPGNTVKATVVLPPNYTLQLQSEAGNVTVTQSGPVKIPAPPPPGN